MMVVVVDHPMAGLSVYGPFAGHDKAKEWCAVNLHLVGDDFVIEPVIGVEGPP